MSDAQKKLLLVLGGILICVLVFFLVYQPNSQKIEDLNSETAKLESDVNMLTALQSQVIAMREDADKHEAETDKYFGEYPSRMTEQKAIYNVYSMMVDTGIRVSAIQPSKDMTFFNQGTVSGMDGAALSENIEGAATGSAAEVSPETKVAVNEIVGKYATYVLAVKGKRTEVMDALDWISENKEHMSVGPLNLSFDEASGKLSGSITVYYYSMNGNGIAYVEPDISGIVIGQKDVFGSFDGKDAKVDNKPTYSDND